MADHTKHLTEDERQTIADGSIPHERAAAAVEHVGRCAACADDIARLRAVLSRAGPAKGAGDAPDAEPAEALWPSIRARIDDSKQASLASTRDAARARRWSTGTRARLVAASMAAACILVAALAVARVIGRRAPAAATVVATEPPDSASAYQDEAQTLLAELELRRAMLRPDALAAIDHDLAVVDSAIVEVRAAIARDPANTALRQLLASTYRQKIEILQRMGNAG